jgi:hypothetical protein
VNLPPLRLLIALFLIGEIFTSLPAQNAAPAPVPPHPTLGELMEHRDSWPAQLTLKVPVRLSIVSNGQEVGSIVSPEGTTVDLVSVSETALEIKVLSASASVTPDQTDLWERVAASSQKSNVASTSPAATPPPAAVTVSPVPPPHPPAQPPNPATVASSPPLQLDYEVSPRDNFTKAAFRFWSPPYTQPIRGVIVLVPGINGDGRKMLANPAWQSFALKYRLALVACFLQGGDYYDAMRGTGAALLEALKEFAQQSGHAEVFQAPLLLYGESAGGQFDYDFALWKPDRVMAFVVNKGGYYDHDEPDSRTCSIPGLFFLGLKDSNLRIQAITGIWTEGRKRGALWALAPQPNSGHEFSKTAAVARPFFDAVLKNRLPDDGLSSDDAPLMNPMQENQGWVGDLTTHEIHDASTDSEPNLNDAWFPDENSAAVWKAFVSN